MSEDRGTAAQRGYGSRWQRYREHFLRRHPLCVFCAARGLITAATVVDHIVPHRGDMRLFWQHENHQALCQPCHDRDKARLERGGALPGCNEAGLPADPGHHWRRGS